MSKTPTIFQYFHIFLLKVERTTKAAKAIPTASLIEVTVPQQTPKATSAPSSRTN
jgi:hypothetical protein